MSKIRIDVIKDGVRTPGHGRFEEAQRGTAEEIAEDLQRILGCRVEVVRVKMFCGEWYEPLRAFDDESDAAITAN